MIAAIYARKSTEQAVADEQKSVVRQIEHARAYALRNGWSVDDACVFVDDGISGAEFANRPGFMRLMGSLKPRPPFQILIMSESSRLGREAWETGYALKQLISAGVRVFFYLEGRECSFDHPMDKLQFSIVQALDEMERTRASQRSTDKALQLARAGHVTGGRVFGYDNVRMDSHTERRVNPNEAAIVRQIFELAAAGVGQKQIAKRLNDQGAIAPRAQRDRHVSWAPSSVHEVLFRSLYRGEVVWNRTRKRDAWGQKRQTARPEAEWLRFDAPALRIVDEELWQAAHARIAEARALYRTSTNTLRGGRPRIESRYLLPGLARCALCGGGLQVRSGNHGSGANRWRVRSYGCSSYHHRGVTVCRNRLMVRVDAADREVLGALEALITPDLVDDVIARVRELLEQPSADPRAPLLAELAELETQTANLADAVAAGGRLPILLKRLQSAEERRQELEAKLQAVGPKLEAARVDWSMLERRAREKVLDLPGLLSRQVEHGRQVLEGLLVEPMRFTPFHEGQRRGYRFVGKVAAAEWLLEGSIDTTGKWRPHRDSNPGFSLERAAS